MLIRLLLLCICIITVSCGSNHEAHARSYDDELEMLPGQNLLIQLEYIGKSPEESLWSKSHDFVSLDTDFYNLTLVNRSDFNFRLLSCEYSLEKGRNGKMKSFYSNKELEKIWGGDVIYPGESKTKFNSYTHSKRFSSNVLYKKYTYQLQVEPNNYTTNSFVVRFLYHRDN